MFEAVGNLEYRAPEFIIEGLIETETLGMVFGDPGCGKSFLAVDIALSVATGTPFHGRDVKQGPVFFIAGEGHNGLARRFAAWSQDRGVSLSGVPLFKSARAAQFLDEENAKSVSDAVAELAALHGDPALIIIDTLARNFGAGDENSTSDMNEFVAAVDELKARFPGCSVLIIHHTGHAEKQRARGAMALKGALDCEFRIEKDGHSVKLTNTKMKDAEPPEALYFEFQSVQLDGDASSAVLEGADQPARSMKLKPMEELARATYIEAAITSGKWDENGFAGLNLEDWRPVFYAKHTGDNTDTKRRAFTRAREGLVKIGLLEVDNDIYRSNDEALLLAIIMKRDSGTDPDIGETCPDAEADDGGTDRTNA